MTDVAFLGDDIVVSPPIAIQLKVAGVPVRDYVTPAVTLGAIPNNLDSITIMENLGIILPTAMMRGEFTYGGRYQPYAHQRVTADHIVRYPRSFVLDEPGTGKTNSSIWAMEYLMQLGLVRKVLVLCPLSCVQSVWMRELMNTAPHRKSVALSGHVKVRKELYAQGYEWNITNHDGVKTLRSEFEADPELDAIIVDEATAFKNESTARCKALKSVSVSRRLTLMTGTPRPQKPIDAYFMCKIVNPKAPQRKYLFEDMVSRANPFSQWTRITRPDANERIREYMQPAVRHRKADCLDLPDVVYVEHKVPPTSEQSTLRSELLKEWLAEHDNSVITAPNAAVRIGKLLQVGQGTIIDTTGVAHEVDNKPRIDALCEYLDSSASKSLVFATYTKAIAKLDRELRKRGYNPAIIDGSTPPDKRAKIISDFQSAGNTLNPIIAHPRTMAHGVTLTAASTIVWYGPTHSVEEFIQANARTPRPGQQHVTRVVMLQSETEEKKVYEAVKNNIGEQQALLDTYSSLF